MQLVKNWQRLKSEFHQRLPINGNYLKLTSTFGIISLLACLIWLLGPHLTWESYAPMAETDKRIYVIACLYLSWLLKILIIDLSMPRPAQYQDAITKKHLYQLQQRFHGALRFLRKTLIARQGKSMRLSDLPWYLLIGPTNAGKTSLLAKSGVNFILQRRRQKHFAYLESSLNCDWWVTRDASILDIPGCYMHGKDFLPGQAKKSRPHSALWRILLALLKHERGKQAISGIIIAMPLPEILYQNDPEKYQKTLHQLFQRLAELQSHFKQTIACQLIITKCDLLPGFTEFFHDSASDELQQAWGVNLTTPQPGENVGDLFVQQFNLLIKKLNDQLLFRLHHERNPMLRPYIKDFPLQIELIREFTLDFLKKFTTQFNFPVRGVYLTSALQSRTSHDHDQSELYSTDIIESLQTDQRSIQVFKEQPPTSRAYFIKQYIAQGLVRARMAPMMKVHLWKHRTAYLTAFAMTSFTAIVLGSDLQQGMEHARLIQRNIENYQIIVQQIQDPDEHLSKTIDLLSTLQNSSNNIKFRVDFSRLFNVFSHQSQQQSTETYQHALRALLLPEIKNYLANYLNMPVNKNTDYLYASLKAYLMLGDASHYRPEFILTTLKEIAPPNVTEAQLNELLQHTQLALNYYWSPSADDNNLVNQTRAYFGSMLASQLAYIILNNMNNNNSPVPIELGQHSSLISHPMPQQIQRMFTANEFALILNQETLQAAQETVTGNWVIGALPPVNNNVDVINALTDQLRIAYLNNYIATWENLLARLDIAQPLNLAQTDQIITNLISNNSPLLQLLQILHDNTYFEPVATKSEKLQSLGILVENRYQAENLLYQIFASLQLLHNHIQTVLNASDERKAAFGIVSNRMNNNGNLDAITQLRLVASKSPEPVRNWLDAIANKAWRYLMQDASNYIDTSWKTNITNSYQQNIADHYPFNPNASREVALNHFRQFFGSQGALANFYNQYLHAFIDTSNAEWRWKTVDNLKLPFSDDALRQIQQAYRISHSFFPNGDNIMALQFTLRPYDLGSGIKSVKVNINNHEFTDHEGTTTHPHVFLWPNNLGENHTSVQFELTNQQRFTQDYPGDWGWFKLINQSFENVQSKNVLLLNFSKNKHPAKYLLSANSDYNPLLTFNLNHFRLPNQLNTTVS